MNDKPSILLTGATGYVGGRLLGRLEEAGYHIRCLVRKPEYLSQRVSTDIELVKGDLLDPDSLKAALKDIDVAYYMVHFLTSAENFEKLEIEAAHNFANIARKAGVKRIIYLSG